MDREIADERRQDDMLQAYLEGMSQLLTDKDRPLHEARMGDSLSTVARASTLTVLNRLGRVRKRSVVQFLYESRLIRSSAEEEEPIVSLRGADLSKADLSNTCLEGANLEGADLRGADLNDAILSWANLRRSDLTGAILRMTKSIETDLSSSDLTRADLSEAILQRSNLSDATLEDAVLRKASMEGANLMGARRSTERDTTLMWSSQAIPNEEIFHQVLSLEGATMPNGQKYEDWLKDREKRQQDE